MKVIDLLNKIANGEEVPEKIKYITTNYIYDSDNQIYYKENYQDIGNYGDLLMELSSHKGIVALNDEIEIIEDTPNEDINVNLAYIDKEYLLDNKDVEKKINEIINRHNILVDKVVDVLDKVNGEDNE